MGTFFTCFLGILLCYPSKLSMNERGKGLWLESVSQGPFLDEYPWGLMDNRRRLIDEEFASGNVSFYQIYHKRPLPSFTLLAGKPFLI